MLAKIGVDAPTVSEQSVFATYLDANGQEVPLPGYVEPPDPWANFVPPAFPWMPTQSAIPTPWANLPPPTRTLPTFNPPPPNQPPPPPPPPSPVLWFPPCPP